MGAPTLPLPLPAAQIATATRSQIWQVVRALAGSANDAGDYSTPETLANRALRSSYRAVIRDGTFAKADPSPDFSQFPHRDEILVSAENGTIDTLWHIRLPACIVRIDHRVAVLSQAHGSPARLGEHASGWIGIYPPETLPQLRACARAAVIGSCVDLLVRRMQPLKHIGLEDTSWVAELLAVLRTANAFGPELAALDRVAGICGLANGFRPDAPAVTPRRARL